MTRSPFFRNSPSDGSEPGIFPNLPIPHQKTITAPANKYRGHRKQPPNFHHKRSPKTSKNRRNICEKTRTGGPALREPRGRRGSLHQSAVQNCCRRLLAGPAPRAARAPRGLWRGGGGGRAWCQVTWTIGWEGWH